MTKEGLTGLTVPDGGVHHGEAAWKLEQQAEGSHLEPKA